MEEKDFSQVFDLHEEKTFQSFFLNSDKLEESLLKSLKNGSKWLVIANIKFSIVLNCLIKAKGQKLFKNNSKVEYYVKELAKITYLLDNALDTLDNISKELVS